MARDRSKDRLKKIASPRPTSEPGFRKIGGQNAVDAPQVRSQSTESTAPLLRQLGGISIGVMIVLGLMFANTLGLRSVGASLAQSWDNVGSEFREDLFGPRKSDDTAATNRLRAHCEPTVSLRTGFQGFGDHSSRYQALPMTEARTVALGEFVECLMKRDRNRLCNASERAIIVEDLRQFSKQRRLHLSLIDDLGRRRGSFAATVAAVQGIDEAYAQVGRERIQEATSDVDRGVRQLVSQGYLAASHFGRQGPPVEMTTIFKEEKVMERPCK